jgi:hypothetical protein
MAFKPEEHLISIRGRNGKPDYLETKWRVVWFREEHPDGGISTEVLAVAPPLVKATVVNGSGQVLATGHASVDEKKAASAVWNGRSLEKAETAAIGRALANAGYGTQFVGDEMDDGVADSPTPQPGAANDKPPIDLGKAREELSNSGDRRATRDMDAIYTATKLHWKDRKHFDNAVKKLVADGVLNSGMTDAQAIAAINANRATEDKANAGWWTDKTVTGTLGADVWKEFGVTLPDALAKLNQTLADFSGPVAVKDAVRNQLQFEAIR